METWGTVPQVPPQVVTEHKLGREQFLDKTCCKAGVPPKAWQGPSTEIRAFPREIFSEPPLPCSGGSLDPCLSPAHVAALVPQVRRFSNLGLAVDFGTCPRRGSAARICAG
jgi:hypothetical protein